MRIQAQHHHLKFEIDLAKGTDLSIPITNRANATKAWYLGSPKIKPVKLEGFVGSVNQGGSVNFRNINFNPHAHGTHTESFGHITRKVYSVNEVFSKYHFVAQLITVNPAEEGGDRVIKKEQLDISEQMKPEALIIRTLPNGEDKLHTNYSNTNPPYLSFEAINHIRKMQIQHLLIDLPSVDREVDGGALQAHHIFWNIPDAPRKNASITELIYVPDQVADGFFLLNLQVAAFENDAAPSRPVIYPISIK